MNVWDQILREIERRVNRHSFHTWFSPTALRMADANRISVLVPNSLFKEWISKHYGEVIREAAAAAGVSQPIDFTVADARPDASEPQQDDTDTRAQQIRLILFDVDGVLTDGKILVHGDGSESKQFDIKDGTAIVWAQRSGLHVGFLSARSSIATAQRASQLGVTLVYQGVANKLDAFDEILSDAQIADAQVAYMGDDLLDMPVLRRAGISAAPADAVADVRRRVHLVTAAAGGDGAARELIEFILRAQGKWESLLDGYLAQRQQT